MYESSLLRGGNETASFGVHPGFAPSLFDFFSHKKSHNLSQRRSPAFIACKQFWNQKMATSLRAIAILIPFLSLVGAANLGSFTEAKKMTKSPKQVRHYSSIRPPAQYSHPQYPHPPAPQPVPAMPIVSRADQVTVDQFLLPQCRDCSDVGTPYMQENGLSCSDWKQIQFRCEYKTPFWFNNRICRHTCSQLGFPYPSDNCCTTDSPSLTPTSSPTIVPSPSPSSAPTGTFLTDLGHTSIVGYGLCEGDCDSDLDCNNGLVCFQRGGWEEVPGCTGEGSPGFDYCIRPPSPSPTPSPIYGNIQSLAVDANNLSVCQGDCDSDSECRDGLRCRQRGANEAVLECDGSPRFGWDYCLPAEPTASPTPSPTAVPTVRPTSGPTPIPTALPTAGPTPLPSARPSPSPTAERLADGRSDGCVVCENRRTAWMFDHGKTCEGWSQIPYKCTEESRLYGYWERNRFCDRTCSEVGHPYPGPPCCVDEEDPVILPEDPVIVPPEASGRAGAGSGSDPYSSGADATGRCFAFTNQCGPDLPCEGEGACCSPWGFCGYGIQWCGACCQSGDCLLGGGGGGRGGGGDRLLRGSAAAAPLPLPVHNSTAA